MLKRLIHLIWVYTIVIIYIYMLRIFVQFSICIYHIQYPIIFKISVLAYQTYVVSDTCIVSVHHSSFVSLTVVQT